MIAASQLVGSAALTRYDDHGDPVYSTHERVLLTLRWFGWASAERLYEALDLDDNWHNKRSLYQERQKISSALAYWVKRGRIETRPLRDRLLEYRLIPPSQWGDAVSCSRCSEHRVTGKTMCQRHLDWERNYKAKRRAA